MTSFLTKKTALGETKSPTWLIKETIEKHKLESEAFEIKVCIIQQQNREKRNANLPNI